MGIGMHKRIESARKSLQMAEEVFDEAVQLVQSKCIHKHIGEALLYNEPVRVCLTCGLSEQFIDGAFLVLVPFNNLPKNEIVEITRAQYYRYRLGANIGVEDRDAIVRNEHHRWKRRFPHKVRGN